MSQQTLIPEFFLLMFLCFFLYSLPTTSSLTLDMVRRDTIDYQLFPKNLSNAQKTQIFAKLSQSRARRLARRPPSLDSTSVNGSLITDTIRPTTKQFLDSVFAVSLDVGSRPYRTYLQLDTGSSLVWVQCQGCRHCMELRHGSFNESSSTSYRKMRYDNPLCKPRLRSGHDCKFEIVYEDGHKVHGIRSLDTISTIQDVVFGCANYINGVTFGDNDGPHNVISGIFGLALGTGNTTGEM